MFTEKSKPGFKRNSKRKANDDSNKTMDNKRPKLKTEEPSWIRHFKSSTGEKYKIGDTKSFNGKIYHYCDAPHRARIKWHTHSPADCRVRQKFLQKKSGKEGSSIDEPAANLVDTTGDDSFTIPESNVDEESSNADSPSNLHALLATAMNLVTDNDVVRDYIAEAINAANSIE